MSQLTTQLLTDQFVRVPRIEGGTRKPWGQYVAIAVSLLAAGLVAKLSLETNAIGALLTATSIMTGLIFTMTMRFWERSLDARASADQMVDVERTATLDRMRSMLIWTVLAGVVSTTWFAAVALVIGTGTADVWVTAVSAALIVYQLAQVVDALISLYAASFTLR